MELRQAIGIVAREERQFRPEAIDARDAVDYVRMYYNRNDYDRTAGLVNPLDTAYLMVLDATEEGIFEAMDWRTPAQKIAEQVAETHFAIATCQDGNIAWGRGPVYRNSMATLRAAIKVAYPDLSARGVSRVVDVRQDCHESIRYCVQYVREHKESPAYSR